MMGAFQSYTPWTVGSNNEVGATWGPLGPWFGVAAGTGVIVAAIYLLYMVARSSGARSASPPATTGHHDEAPTALPVDLNAREIQRSRRSLSLCLALRALPKAADRCLEEPINAHVAAIREPAPKGRPPCRRSCEGIEKPTRSTPPAETTEMPRALDEARAEATRR